MINFQTSDQKSIKMTHNALLMNVLLTQDPEVISEILQMFTLPLDPVVGFSYCLGEGGLVLGWVLQCLVGTWGWGGGGLHVGVKLCNSENIAYYGKIYSWSKCLPFERSAKLKDNRIHDTIQSTTNLTSTWARLCCCNNVPEEVWLHIRLH